MKKIKEDLDIFFYNDEEYEAKIHECSIEILNNNNKAMILIKERNRNLLLIYIDTIDDLNNLLKNFEQPTKATIYLKKIDIEKILKQTKGSTNSIYKGTCTAYAQDPVTYVITNIKKIPVKNDSNLIIRFDKYFKGKDTIITNEPSNKYKNFLRIKKENYQQMQEMKVGDEALVYMWGFFITTLITALVLSFAIVQALISKSKREKELEQKLEKIVKKKYKIYKVEEQYPNAFCTLVPVIFITDSLKEILNERELMAVVLHEVSHIDNKDIIKNLAATNGFVALLLGILSWKAYSSSTPVFLILTFMLFFVCNVLGLTDIIFAKTYGRYQEKRSDSYATKHGYGKDLISALTKIEHWSDKVEQKRPCGKLCNIFKKVGDYIDEHPKLKERIENILKSEKDILVLISNISYVKKISYLKKRFMENR